jgi:polyisoprenyl-teichoic acid--peptidoglycan teichoic acid transferase
MRLPRLELNVLLILALVIAVALITTGALRIAVGARRNMAALSVTAAPLPANPATAAPAAANRPILTLPPLTITAEAVAAPVRAASTATTILLLGSDRRPGTQVIPRTDALMVVHLDPAQGRVALLSLPRDLWAAIPGHGDNRINNAYLYGERAGPPGAGMSLAQAAVSDLLGVPIDYVALIDFAGFATLIDAIGGVVVDVPAELVDRRFPTADNRTTTVRFAAGPQRMNGAAALTYSRIRNPDLDFGRIQRQQQVLLAIAERLRTRGYLTNLLAAEELTGSLVGYVQTDMPPALIAELAFALRDLEAAKVERYALREADVEYGVAADRYALRARPGRLEGLVARWQGAE